MTLTRYLGLKMSQTSADVVRLALEGLSYPEIAGELGISESCVMTYCSRLRKRGLTIPRSRRFKLVAVNESDERYEFIGKKDLEQRGGYVYRCAHRAAQCGGQYLGMTWSKESI